MKLVRCAQVLAGLAMLSSLAANASVITVSGNSFNLETAVDRYAPLAGSCDY